MKAAGERARRWIVDGLTSLGTILSIVLFIYLLRHGVHGPIALVSSFATMLCFVIPGILINPPPAGTARTILWAMLGFCTVGVLIAATVMHWETSNR